MFCANETWNINAYLFAWHWQWFLHFTVINLMKSNKIRIIGVSLQSPRKFDVIYLFIASHTKISHKLLTGPKRTPQYYVCPDGLKSTSNILFSSTARERENSNCIHNFWINHTAIITVINYIIILLSLLKILIEVQALIIFN